MPLKWYFVLLYVCVNTFRKKLEGEKLNNSHSVVFLLLMTVPSVWVPCISVDSVFTLRCHVNVMHFALNMSPFVPFLSLDQALFMSGFSLFLQHTLPFETEALRWSTGCVYVSASLHRGFLCFESVLYYFHRLHYIFRIMLLNMVLALANNCHSHMKCYLWN